YEVSNVGEVLKSERAFRQDVDMRLDVLERGIAALGADASVLVARVIRAIETEIAPRAAEIEALLVGYRDGVPAAAVAESAERFFLTPARRAAIIAEAITTGDPSAAIAAAIASLAPIASPAFTGAPTAPTPPDDNASARLATTAFVATRIAALVNGAPDDLRDFDALANAIGNDPDFAVTVAAALAALSSTVAAITPVPVGTTIWVNGAVAPAGFVKENGALLSRTTFASLWAYAQGSGRVVTDAEWVTGNTGAFSSGDGATNFRLPDSRGEFVRALDDGRGIDSGRALGSWQADDLKSHIHRVDRPIGSGNPYGNAAAGGTGGDTTPTTATGGTETRPRNVSKLACIKY
ncbi:hypothetical protein CH338_29780, partial [Rhodoplanes elegans]